MVVSDRCSRQFTGSCRTVVADTVWSCQTDVEDSLWGHVGPLYRSCGGAQCAMSDLYMILCITPPQTQIGVKIETYLRLKQRD
ncbi:unnamed protein product [Camellia sinensis]